MKNFEKALDFLKNCLQIRKTNYGKIHYEVADVQDALGCMYLKKGDFDSANKEFHFALKTFKRVLGKSNLRIADLYNNYGFIHTKLQNLQKAKKCHERCLNIYKVKKKKNYILKILNN